MVNFVYAIGDRATGECLLVDPAYAVGDLIGTVGDDGMTVTGVLVTHYHPDHVGGSMMGHTIEGIAALLERVECPIHLHATKPNGSASRPASAPITSSQHESGDTVTVGGIEVTLLHTPGHTPGSQCFLVDGRLVAGDTLFLEGCGRTDLPGSRPARRWPQPAGAWPRCPTRRSSSRDTVIRWRAAPPWMSSRR